jgi:hypothetical protein
MASFFVGLCHHFWAQLMETQMNFACRGSLRKLRLPGQKACVLRHWSANVRPETIRNGSHVGTSSDWMQQSSSGCQADIAMGPVPRSSYGCGLRAGQGSKKVHRMAISEFSGEEFSTNVLVSEVYGPSDFLMTPPAFVPSLYSMFLEAAYARTEVAVIEESKAEGSSEVLNEENTRISVSKIHVIDAGNNRFPMDF